MFGFSKLHQEKLTEVTFSDSARILDVQISERVNMSGVGRQDINLSEHISFKCWEYYLAYQNCGLLPRDVQRRMSALANVTMDYLMRKFRLNEFKAPEQLRRSQLVLEDITATFRQYDDAFNIGKARSFNMLVSEQDIFAPLSSVFVERLSLTASVRNKLLSCRDGFESVLAQSMMSTMKLMAGA